MTLSEVYLDCISFPTKYTSYLEVVLNVSAKLLFPVESFIGELGELEQMCIREARGNASREKWNNRTI